MNRRSFITLVVVEDRAGVLAESRDELHREVGKGILKLGRGCYLFILSKRMVVVVVVVVV